MMPIPSLEVRLRVLAAIDVAPGASIMRVSSMPANTSIYALKHNVSFASHGVPSVRGITVIKKMALPRWIKNPAAIKIPSVKCHYLN